MRKDRRLGGSPDQSPCLAPRCTPDKQVSQRQGAARGGSRTSGRPWCPLESVAFCFLPVLTPSQAFTICWMLLSLMKTGYGNHSCPGERRHWDASRWGYLLTNLRVSSFTFGLNRLVLAAYHGPCSRVKAAAPEALRERPAGRQRRTPPQGSVLAVGAAWGPVGAEDRPCGAWGQGRTPGRVRLADGRAASCSRARFLRA